MHRITKLLKNFVNPKPYSKIKRSIIKAYKPGHMEIPMCQNTVFWYALNCLLLEIKKFFQK